MNSGDRAAIVLVHGAFQNATAWSRVKQILGAQVERVIKINASHASSVTKPDDVAGAILGVVKQVSESLGRTA